MKMAEGCVFQSDVTTLKKYLKFLNYSNKHGAKKRPCPAKLLEEKGL